MDFLDKITQITKSATNKANHILEINRLNSKIHAEEKTIAESIQKIGTYYVTKMDAGASIPEEIVECYDEIANRREKITVLQVQIQQLKDEKDQPASKIKCMFCGKLNGPNKKFCEECGSRLDIEKEKSYCSVCGAELLEGLKFCGECGTKIQ